MQWLVKSALSWIAIPCKILKQFLVRKWAKDIAKAAGSVTRPAANYAVGKNLIGNGGQERRPYTVTWQSLFDQCNSTELRLAALNKKYLAVQEFLFFAYFGPLEAWCERNCVGPFMLWTDDHRIHCMVFDTQDCVLWQLTWGNAMPRYVDMTDYFN